MVPHAVVDKFANPKMHLFILFVYVCVYVWRRTRNLDWRTVEVDGGSRSLKVSNLSLFFGAPSPHCQIRAHLLLIFDGIFLSVGATQTPHELVKIAPLWLKNRPDRFFVMKRKKCRALSLFRSALFAPNLPKAHKLFLGLYARFSQLWPLLLHPSVFLSSPFSSSVCFSSPSSSLLVLLPPSTILIASNSYPSPNSLLAYYALVPQF